MSALGQLFGHYRYAAIALVTVLTLGIVGAVVLTTTSAGCGPANALRIKTARCVEGGKVAAVTSPGAKPGYTPGQSTPSSVPPPPDNSGASANPPYNPGASSNPPYNPGASNNPPYSIPDSGTYPPLPYAASGSAPPGVALSCRLPVFAGGPGSGGFIVFPGQTFVADPRSAVTAPSPSPGTPTPTPPQYGPGYPAGWYGLTYDAAYSKWLPVPYRWVSPDGVHYAYPLGGDIYVQDVSNGTQLEMGKGRGFSVLDVINEGVYAVLPNQPGLWFLDFSFSGTVSQLSDTGFWQGVAHGEAYGTPTSSVPQGATNTIEKLDFQFRTVTPFFSQPGGQSTLLGFDLQGNPVIQTWYANPNGTAIFIVGPQNYFPIAAITYGPYVQNPPFPSGSPIADSHGLWFSVGNGVILYSNGAWYWMAGIGGQLAGQCL